MIIFHFFKQPCSGRAVFFCACHGAGSITGYLTKNLSSQQGPATLPMMLKLRGPGMLRRAGEVLCTLALRSLMRRRAILDSKFQQ